VLHANHDRVLNGGIFTIQDMISGWLKAGRVFRDANRPSNARDVRRNKLIHRSTTLHCSSACLTAAQTAQNPQENYEHEEYSKIHNIGFRAGSLCKFRRLC